MIDGIFIKHGFYDGNGVRDRRGNYFPMALKLRAFLAEKFAKFRKTVEFTYGNDSENHIEAVSVCHPSDQFATKDGYPIVVNRIKELRRKGYDTKATYIQKISGRDINGKRNVTEVVKPKYPWIYKLER